MNGKSQASDIISPRRVAGLIAIAAAAFLVILYFSIFGIDLRPGRATDANAFSQSAIGHKAFVGTLKRLGIKVSIGRYQSLARAAPDSLILLLEPQSVYDLPDFAELEAGQNLLIVLPKRYGEPDSDNPGWLKTSHLIDPSIIRGELQIAKAYLDINRLDAAPQWRRNDFGIAPTIDNLQLLRDPKGRMTPLIVAEEGILFGSIHIRNKTVWLLSDPDMLATHGLGAGQNANLILAIIRQLLPDGGGIVIDETIHGFELEPNLLPRLLAPPFLGVTIATVALLLGLVWLGAMRFGRPADNPEGLRAGKLTLIESAADLLRLGAKPENLIRRFAQILIADTARTLNAPKGMNEKTLIAWLDQTARLGGGRRGRDLIDLLEEVEALAALKSPTPERRRRLLIALTEWKKEMLDGSAANPRYRR